MKENDPPERVAKAITRFVESPITNLVKGIALLVIGLSEASRTLSDDLVHKQLRVGHGLIIIGAFGILSALPHLIDSLVAGQRYIELRDEKARTKHGPEAEPTQSNERAK